jgi:hypothetical protein
MNRNDRGFEHWEQVLNLVRAHAGKHARRHLVLCDAHVPSGGLVRNGKLLLDFHSFPLRIMETPDKPQEAVLKVGFSDSIYGRSKGGITPSGWAWEEFRAAVFNAFRRRALFLPSLESPQLQSRPKSSAHACWGGIRLATNRNNGTLGIPLSLNVARRAVPKDVFPLSERVESLSPESRLLWRRVGHLHLRRLNLDLSSVKR